MIRTKQERKGALLEAFCNSLHQLDYARPSATTLVPPHYIQHRAHIEPCREGLFNLTSRVSPDVEYEPGSIVAEEIFVTVHGRHRGLGLPVNWNCGGQLRNRGWRFWSSIGT